MTYNVEGHVNIDEMRGFFPHFAMVPLVIAKFSLSNQY